MECVVCAECADVQIKCCRCSFEMCNQCTETVGRCPQCRFVYDLEKDETLSRELRREHVEYMDEDDDDEDDDDEDDDDEDDDRPPTAQSTFSFDFVEPFADRMETENTLNVIGMSIPWVVHDVYGDSAVCCDHCHYDTLYSRVMFDADTRQRICYYCQNRQVFTSLRDATIDELYPHRNGFNLLEWFPVRQCESATILYNARVASKMYGWYAIYWHSTWRDAMRLFQSMDDVIHEYSQVIR